MTTLITVLATITVAFISLIGTIFTTKAENELYPWMNQAEIISDGFRNQMMNTNVTSVRDATSIINYILSKIENI